MLEHMHIVLACVHFTNAIYIRTVCTCAMVGDCRKNWIATVGAIHIAPAMIKARAASTMAQDQPHTSTAALSFAP